MSLPDGPTEDDTERDGFLSYAGEWHAVAHGVYNGLTDSLLSARPIPDNPDVEEETHYYKGGYVLGTLIQAGLIVLASYFGADAVGLVG